jgi:hypothetical protein
MKYLTTLILVAVSLLFIGCVTPDMPRDYAQRAFPDCENFVVVAHQSASTAVSEVEMSCPNDEGKMVTMTKSIKCTYGHGIMVLWEEFDNISRHQEEEVLQLLSAQ